MLKILVIDDSDGMRQVLKRMIRACGWRTTVVEARDGEHALRVLKSERPDLVITDWEMPGVSGISLVKGFVRNDLSIPIGMVTANASPEHIAEATEAGASFVLGKPFSLDRLRTTLAPYILGKEPGGEKDVQMPKSVSMGTAIAESLNQLMGTLVHHDDGDGVEINGSTGAVFSFVDALGEVRFILALDWCLANYLAAGLFGDGSADPEQGIRTRRVTPQVQNSLQEVAAVFRGILRTDAIGDVRVEGALFRGDGALRSEYWHALLLSRDFRNAKHLPIHIRLAGVGGGELSLYSLR
jgi:two-component system, chemotaxis family, chemotaxis protein CheY